MNLYYYANSNPLIITDMFGLSGCYPIRIPGPWEPPTCPPGVNIRTPAACCAQAKANNLHINPRTGRPSGGGVICCDGQKVPCSWQPIIRPPGGRINPIYQSIIRDCTTQHEEDHLDAQDCPWRCPHLDRLPPRQNINLNQEECYAYRKELKCLNNKIKECNKATEALTCNALVRARINQIEGIIQQLCNMPGVR